MQNYDRNEGLINFPLNYLKQTNNFIRNILTRFFPVLIAVVLLASSQLMAQTPAVTSNQTNVQSNPQSEVEQLRQEVKQLKEQIDRLSKMVETIAANKPELPGKDNSTVDTDKTKLNRRKRATVRRSQRRSTIIRALPLRRKRRAAICRARAICFAQTA